MLSQLVPDLVLKHVFNITPGLLKELGLLAVAADLDGTLATAIELIPDGKIMDWKLELERGGVPLIVVSNNDPGRVSVFCESLGVPYISRARKPFTRSYKRAAEMLGIPADKIAMVGDKIFTDVFGAKRCGMKAMLVEPLGIHDNPLYKARRAVETPFIKCAKRNIG